MLELIVTISLFTQGLFVVTTPPYLLAPVKKWIAERMGGVYREAAGEGWFEFTGWRNEVFKPFLGCPVCMASFWGIVIYSCTVAYTLASLYELPIVLVGASLLNFVIYNRLIEGRI